MKKPSVPQPGDQPSCEFYRGDLSETTVPVLLLDAFERRATGSLTLHRSGARKVIHFLLGRPIFAQSSQREESIGPMLVRKGLLEPQEHEAATRHAKTKKLPYGGALVDLGLLTSLELNRQLQVNVREKVESSLFWRSGSWMFIDDEQVESKVPSLDPLDTVEVVFEGLRDNYDEQQVLAPLRGRERFVLELLDHGRAHAGRFAAIFGVELLDAAALGATVGFLFNTEGLTRHQAAIQINVLLVTGLARLRRASEASQELKKSWDVLPLTEADRTPVEVDPGEPADPPAETPELEPESEPEPEPQADLEPEADPEPRAEHEPEPAPEPRVDLEAEITAPAARAEATSLAESASSAPKAAPGSADASPARGSWFPVLGAFFLGATLASLFFVVADPMGSRSAGQRGTGAVTPPPVAASRARTRTTAPLPVTTALEVKATPVATRETSARADTKTDPPTSGVPAEPKKPAELKQPAAPAPTTAQATTAPAAATPAAVEKKPRSPVEAAGQLVARVMRPCFGANPGSSRRIAVYVTTTGKVMRAFLARLPKATAAQVGCVKGKLVGLALPLTLRKDDFVEWRIRYGTSPPQIKLNRPGYLKDQ